jgi:hypothetical protein
MTRLDLEAAETQAMVSQLLDFGIRMDFSAGFNWRFWESDPQPSEPLWTMEDFQLIFDAAHDLSAAMGGPEVLKARLGQVILRQQRMVYGGLAQKGSVTLNASQFNHWVVVHELAHAWDAANSWQLSQRMQAAMSAGFPSLIRYWFWPDDPANWYNPGKIPPPCGIDRYFTEKEDFAEAVTAWVYPEEAKINAAARGWPYHDPARNIDYENFADTPRGKWIGELIQHF